ncbi:hypothetical protein [Amorphus sp. MBR-141]
MNALRVSGTAALVSMLVAFAQPSLAIEPTGNEVADAFLTAIEPNDGGTLTHGDVAASGSTVTISDIKVGYTGDAGSGTALLGTTAIANGRVADGVLTADSLSIEDVTMDEVDSQSKLTVASIVVNKPEIPIERPATASGEPSSSLSDYQDAELTKLVFTDENGSELPVERALLAVTRRIDGDPRGGTIKLENAVMETATIEDEETRKRLTDLGYSEIVVDLAAEGDWNSDDGTATLKQLEVSAKDMGTLKMSGQFLGLTPEVVAALQQDDNDFSQLMQTMQGVSVAGLTIRYDDASLAGRAMELTAKDQSVTKPELIDTLNMQVSQMLAMLENKGFEEKVSAAVKMFLNDPQSLEITAKPAAPVPFAQIVGTVMMAPQTLPNVLSVGVAANEPAAEPATGATDGSGPGNPASGDAPAKQ